MRRIFHTTLGQILAILVGSTLGTLLLLVALVFIQHTHPVPPWPWAVSHHIISLVNLLDGVPPEHRERASLLASVEQYNIRATIKQSAIPCTGRSASALILSTTLRTQLDKFPDMTIGSCGIADEARDIQVIVPLGNQVLEINTGDIGPHPFNVRSPSFGVLLFMMISLAALSIWATWRVIRPLRHLSERAAAFGHALSPHPIAEEGPAEIRNIAHTFNIMQERIARSMQDRTRMLTAIGHDLRTPLTRMRLQLEMDGKDIDSGKLMKNIDLMQEMVTSTLSFLNGGMDDEAKEWVDLDALLSTLCDEYEDSGADIRYEGRETILFRCCPNAIQRALSNLMENAIHFGHATRVTAAMRDGAILIQVADDGPGIPSEHLKDVLEPFFRLDASRNTRPGSIGLGLSIVQEIVHAHDGILTLRNRQPCGLLAEIIFPQATPDTLQGT